MWYSFKALFQFIYYISSINTDEQGNLYTSGSFCGTSSPTTICSLDFGANTIETSSYGGFIVKTPVGQPISQSKVIENWTKSDQFVESWPAFPISNSSVIITGTYKNTLNFGNVSVTSTGYNDIFIAKLSISEDNDNDNDGVLNDDDLCLQGLLNWTSNSTTDWDGDGCHDVTEDADDDNDGVIDSNDICPNTIVTGYVNSDGCLDSDKDGVLDSVDDCPTGSKGWVANSTNDYDMDGCLDNDCCCAGKRDWR